MKTTKIKLAVTIFLLYIKIILFINPGNYILSSLMTTSLSFTLGENLFDTRIGKRSLVFHVGHSLFTINHKLLPRFTDSMGLKQTNHYILDEA